MGQITENSFERIKKKFHSLDNRLYWGDDFDVRFYLISKLSEIKNKSILDVGGGLGVISSELDRSNFCINLDLSFQDLIKCNNEFGNSINVLNASMTNISLKENCFDYVICAHILGIPMSFDRENNLVIKNKINKFPTMSKVLEEVYRILKPNGILLLTNGNNAYYKSDKLTYDELKLHLKENFENFSISFFNTSPGLKSQNRKLNMANILPKVFSKIRSREKIIKSLIHKDSGRDQSSVSFFVEVKKAK